MEVILDQAGNSVFISREKMNLVVWGMVYSSCKQNYHVVINNKLTVEKQDEVIAHELEHIKNDFPNNHYIIGIDMQHYDFENRENKDLSKLVDSL